MAGGGVSIEAQAQEEEEALRTESDSTTHRAVGQEASRAERWRQQRWAKKKVLEPPQPGVWERIGRFFSRIGGSVTPRRLMLTIPKLSVAGVRPVLKGLDQPAGGLLYEPPPLNTDTRLVSLEATASIEWEHQTELLLGLETDRYVGYAYGRYRHRPKEGIYGIGPDSRLQDEARFRRDEGLFGILVGRSLDSRTLLGAHTSYQLNRIGPGRGDLPRIQAQFGDALPGGDRNIDYLMWGTFVEFDSRDTAYERAFGRRFAPTEDRLRSVSLEATRGFYMAAEVTHNLDFRDRDFDFTRFTVDMREFLPINKRLLHGFSFRQFASVTQASDGQMPFYRMQSLGGARSLRGYPSDRFRDRNVVLVNAEVQCEIWHWLDMALFTDAGHVFRNISDVEVLAPRVGYGIGLQVKKGGQTLGRVDFARSVEGFRITADLGSLF